MGRGKGLPVVGDGWGRASPGEPARGGGRLFQPGKSRLREKRRRARRAGRGRGRGRETWRREAASSEKTSRGIGRRG